MTDRGYVIAMSNPRRLQLANAHFKTKEPSDCQPVRLVGHRFYIRDRDESDRRSACPRGRPVAQAVAWQGQDALQRDQ